MTADEVRRTKTKTKTIIRIHCRFASMSATAFRLIYQPYEWLTTNLTYRSKIGCGQFVVVFWGITNPSCMTRFFADGLILWILLLIQAPEKRPIGAALENGWLCPNNEITLGYRWRIASDRYGAERGDDTATIIFCYRWQGIAPRLSRQGNRKKWDWGCQSHLRVVYSEVEIKRREITYRQGLVLMFSIHSLSTPDGLKGNNLFCQ